VLDNTFDEILASVSSYARYKFHMVASRRHVKWTMKPAAFQVRVEVEVPIQNVLCAW
jgi:hypothetical protein